MDETRLLEDAKAQKSRLHLLQVLFMSSHEVGNAVLLRVSFVLLKPCNCCSAACVSNPCQEA